MTAIRVLVVDDSVVIRRLVASILDAEPGIEVVGTAINGRAGLEKFEALKPDVVTMDVEMPEMDGIAAVRALRQRGVRVPIIMFSTLTERGADSTFDALAAGATDYVTKPANVGSITRSVEQVRQSLVPLIRSLVRPTPADHAPLTRAPQPRASQSVLPPPRLASAAASARPGTPASPASPATSHLSTVPAGAARSLRTNYRMLVIGSSTGGPEALHTVLTALPPLPVPVVVVQHMPPVFTAQFAARLDRACPVPVREASEGVLLAPGTITIAQGGRHLKVVRRSNELVAALDDAEPENYCRPAVDVLFRSAATAAGGPVLGLVLTGMGADGAQGSRHLAAAGGAVIVQDRDTSVVWGMPGAVVAQGAADQVLALGAVADELQRRLGVSHAIRTSQGAL